MSQLIHSVARVRAMESQLLNPNAVERMISAESFDAAYAVLDDLGYAEEASYFRKNKDFEGALEMGLYSSAEIFKGFGLDSVRKVLTVVWDIQNISLLLKSKLKGEDEDDSESNCIPYGYYSIAELKKSVFHGSSLAELATMLSQAEKISSGEERDMFISSTLFDNALREAKGNRFLLSYLEKVKTAESIKSDFATHSVSELSSLYPSYSVLLAPLSTLSSKGAQGALLETLLDESMVSFLKDSSLGKIDGMEALFSFFWRKERNSRVIRSILLAKKAGLTASEIRDEFTSFVF